MHRNCGTSQTLSYQDIGSDARFRARKSGMYAWRVGLYDVCGHVMNMIRRDMGRLYINGLVTLDL